MFFYTKDEKELFATNNRIRCGITGKGFLDMDREGFVCPLCLYDEDGFICEFEDCEHCYKVDDPDLCDLLEEAEEFMKYVPIDEE